MPALSCLLAGLVGLSAQAAASPLFGRDDLRVTSAARYEASADAGDGWRLTDLLVYDASLPFLSGNDTLLFSREPGWLLTQTAYAASGETDFENSSSRAYVTNETGQVVQVTIQCAEEGTHEKTEHYTFDEAGNISSLVRNGQTISLPRDSEGRITGSALIAAAYDEDGRITGWQQTDTGTIGYAVYDARGALSQVTLVTGASLRAEYYFYDSQGYLRECFEYYNLGQPACHLTLYDYGEGNAALEAFTPIIPTTGEEAS